MAIAGANRRSVRRPTRIPLVLRRILRHDWGVDGTQQR